MPEYKSVLTYRRVQFLIIARPGDDDGDKEAGTSENSSESSSDNTTARRPFGALPRAVENHPGGPEAGFLSQPYRRYGSPYPGVYQPIPPDSPASVTFSTDLSSLEDCVDDDKPYSVHKEHADQDDSRVQTWEVIRQSDDVVLSTSMTRAGFPLPSS